jgi:hypothetical protein
MFLVERSLTCPHKPILVRSFFRVTAIVIREGSLVQALKVAMSHSKANERPRRSVFAEQILRCLGRFFLYLDMG